jgi:hypothetical protein
MLGFGSGFGTGPSVVLLSERNVRLVAPMLGVSGLPSMKRKSGRV